MRIHIPHFATLNIDTIVCDYNGTLAKDGLLQPKVAGLLKRLGETFELYVITADTFGTVARHVEPLGIEVKILRSDDHTEEKRAFVESLGAWRCAALGNGNNDASMLQIAALGICILEAEGCTPRTLASSDLLCRDIQEALALFLQPRRIVATLRR